VKPSDRTPGRPSQLARFVVALIAIVAIAIIAWLGLAGGFSPRASEVPMPPSPIDGVVVSVDARSLTEVRSFKIRTADGTTFDLTMGTLENATEFTPSHLLEHQATSGPIRAYYRLVDNVPVVYRLEDAPQG
jgi:hypothetical protein